MTITIPKNDYVKPTELREEVIQKVCNKFIEYYIPNNIRWNKNDCYYHENSKYGLSEFKYQDSKEGVRVNGCEMEQVFSCLLNAGYHIFFKWINGYNYYVVSKKPYLREGWSTVEEFNEFMD